MKTHYLLALLLLLAACSTTDTAGPATGDAADPGTQGDQDVVPAGDAEEEFNELFAQRNQEWKIAYDLKTSADGKEEIMQMTQYLKGEDLRMDATVQGMESRTYIVDEVFTMCNKADGEWACFQSTPSDADNTVSTTEWEDSYEEDATKYDILADGTKTVAGVTATCYKIVEQGNENSVVRYCFSKDGAPLYTYFSDGQGTSEMIATSYSKSVSGSDFMPPAEPQDMAALYGGAGGTQPAGGDYCSYCDYFEGEEKADCLASC